MFKKTSLYGVAALALSMASVTGLTTMPAHAQSASYTATTPAAKSSSASSSSSSSASNSASTSAPESKSTGSGAVDFSGSSSTPSSLENMAADSVEDSERLFDSLAGESTTDSDSGTSTTATKSSNDDKPRWYDDDGNPFEPKYYEEEGGGILLALQRDPQLPTGHFILAMIGSNSFVSCMKVHPPKFSTEFNQNGTMTVKIEKFRVDKRDMPQYPHYECNTAPQQVKMNVNMSKELLQENGVKKIRFQIGRTTETYLVKLTENYVQLTPESRHYPQFLRVRPLEVSGVNTTMKLWFYPENTVILTADGTEKDITLENRLNELARAKGLIPLTEIMPEHASFRKTAGYHYYVDKAGRYTVGNGELFDYIQADAMKFGLEADEPVKKNVAVFIRKPGQYD